MQNNPMPEVCEGEPQARIGGNINSAWIGKGSLLGRSRTFEGRFWMFLGEAVHMAETMEYTHDTWEENGAIRKLRASRR